MSPLNSNSRKRRSSRQKAKHSSQARSNKQAKKTDQRLSARQQEERVRCLDALNLYRRGKVKSVSAAARSAGTTLRAMRRSVPAALLPSRGGGRIRVRASDPYSALVEIITDSGATVVSARGSRQRELAGRHRATYFRVLRKEAPPSALDQYRGKKVGGHELLSDFEQLRLFARAGILGQLDTLYVSPDVSV